MAQTALTIHLEPDAEAPAAARRTIRRVIGAGEPATIAELLVSELVTNAVRHGHGDTPIQLSLQHEASEGSWTVEVHGSGSLESRGTRTVGGFGLVLVDRLADEWGIDTVADGVRSWFRLSSATAGA